MRLVGCGVGLLAVHVITVAVGMCVVTPRNVSTPRGPTASPRLATGTSSPASSRSPATRSLRVTPSLKTLLDWTESLKSSSNLLPSPHNLASAKSSTPASDVFRRSPQSLLATSPPAATLSSPPSALNFTPLSQLPIFNHQLYVVDYGTSASVVGTTSRDDQSKPATGPRLPLSVASTSNLYRELSDAKAATESPARSLLLSTLATDDTGAANPEDEDDRQGQQPRSPPQMLKPDIIRASATSLPTAPPLANVTSDGLQTHESALMTTYLSVVLVMSVLCNGTVGCVLYSKPQLLTVSNSFVLNLAVCQLGLSVFVLPFCATSVALGDWVFSAAWCRGQSYLLVVLLVVLHYTLLVISLDRNYAIVNSLRYPYVYTQKLGNCVLAGCWGLGVTVGLPPLLGWGRYAYSRGQHLCTVAWRASTSYTFLFISLAFFLPLALQCWCYLSIFRAALSHWRRSAKVFPSSTHSTTTTTTTTSTSRTSSSSTDTRSPGLQDDVTSDAPSGSVHLPLPRVRPLGSTQCKAVKTLLLIAASYFACWTAFILAASLRWHGETVPPSLDLTSSAGLFLSCFLNPLIYAFMNRATRHEISKFYRRVCGWVIGRPPLPFSDSANDPVSVTWTTSLSSGRPLSGLWSTPSQRVRRNSKSIAGVPRTNVEMVPIQEEPELSEEIQHSISGRNNMASAQASCLISKKDKRCTETSKGQHTDQTGSGERLRPRDVPVSTVSCCLHRRRQHHDLADSQFITGRNLCMSETRVQTSTNAALKILGLQTEAETPLRRANLAHLHGQSQNKGFYCEACHGNRGLELILNPAALNTKFAANKRRTHPLPSHRHHDKHIQGQAHRGLPGEITRQASALPPSSSPLTSITRASSTALTRLSF